MPTQNHTEKGPRPEKSGPAWHLWVLVGLCLLIVVVGLFRRLHTQTGVNTAEAKSPGASESARTSALPQPSRETRAAERAALPAASAEEIVAQKLAQFAQSRRAYAVALARRHNVQVSPEVEGFFAAVESGNWNEIEAAFNKLNGGDSSAGHAQGRPAEVQPLWPAIIDAYGAAEQVHLWPAQKLLDYGNAVLAALRPGMVYVGGTDNGRWVPELLNDTTDGERHIVLTQNALADGTYLDYLRLQYDDRFANLSPEDSQQAFQQYLADAQKRLAHDQQFPDEPKQLRPGEDVRVTDNRVQVSGQVAVMAINELLLQTLMQKNPNASFAIEESFPFRGTYADALPLGPLMELRAGNDQNSFTPDLAAQSLDYWRNAAQQVLSDPSAASSDTVLKSYSHDTVAAANLLAAHNFSSEAEQAYRLASQLYAANPEPVLGLAGLLAGSGRENEARQLLDDFAKNHPEEQKSLQQNPSAMLLWTVKPAAR